MEHVSPFIPQINFEGKPWRRVKASHVDVKIDAFFEYRDIENYTEVSAPSAISDSDFRTEYNGGVPFCYFYDIIFENTNKKDETVSGVSYTITFDRHLARADEDKKGGHCSHTDLHFSTILLGEEPVFYYLYFDLQEILSKMRDMDRGVSSNYEC